MEQEEAGGIEAIEEIEFEETVLRSAKPAVAVFAAEWSGPCRMLLPIVEEALKERNAEPWVVRVNVDEAASLVKRFEVLGLPTLLVIRGGVAVERLSGTFSKGDLHRFLDLTGQ